MNTIVNKVQLIGRLGIDPEVRSLDNGRKMARLRIATNEGYRDAKGEKVENTQWHDVVAWGTTAEFAEKFLTKGKQVLIEGRLVNSEYTDKEGNKRYSTDVHVNEFLILDKLDKKEN